MNYLDLTDEQVLAEVGNFGPGIVGQYLFERAEYLRFVALGNTLGPEARSHDFQPSEAALTDLAARGMVKALDLDVTGALVVAPVPPSDGVESVEWESTESPTVQVTPPKRGPGRPRKER